MFAQSSQASAPHKKIHLYSEKMYVWGRNLEVEGFGIAELIHSGFFPLLFSFHLLCVHREASAAHHQHPVTMSWRRWRWASLSDQRALSRKLKASLTFILTEHTHTVTHTLPSTGRNAFAFNQGAMKKAAIFPFFNQLLASPGCWILRPSPRDATAVCHQGANALLVSF